MPDTRTRSKVKLGAFMKALRERAGRKTEPTAQAVRISRPTITRAESGHNRPGFPLLQTLLGYYGATDDEREEAIRLWEAAKQEPGMVEHYSVMPPKYKAFLRDEAEAASARTLEQTIIPGLLQIPEYTRAVRAAAYAFIRSDVNAEREATSRAQRQHRVDGTDPLILHFLIDEAVLRRAVGGPAVMADQLRHLLDVMNLPNVTLQVIPFGAGEYGVMTGAVTILGFADKDEPDTVYLEYPAGGECIEDEDDVRKFVATFESAAAKALPVKRSAALIRDVLEEQ